MLQKAGGSLTTTKPPETKPPDGQEDQRSAGWPDEATQPCAETEEELLASLRGGAPPIAIVIYHRQSAEIVQLFPKAAMVIGRVPEADIAISDPTLSRQHARIELLGNDVWITDLGSRNGTTINGSPIRRSKIRPGDDVMLGEVTLSIHTSANHTRGVEHHAIFAANLSEELTRAEIFGHHLALLMIRRTDASLGDGWTQRIRQLMRPVDRVALFDPCTVEVLLPETDHALASQRAQELLVAGLHCGLATYPGPARRADDLLTAALEALSGCDDTHSLRAASDGRPVATITADETASPPIVGRAMGSVYDTVKRVASSRFPVLIVGETGVGKELVARAIHEASPRRKAKLRCINCGAIPRELVQSVLFGHERGAFTGAAQRQRGAFEQAHQSTLLLDEIGELSPEAQVALLRVLETGNVHRVGSSQEIPVDVRIVSATHRDLEAMCDAGTFRWDLYYRLHTITLEVPPLRHRPDEIEPLARYFVERACAVSGVGRKEIGDRVIERLRHYRWPGNVRELRNAVERAVLVARQTELKPSDLPDRIGVAMRPATRLRDPLGRAMDVRDDTPHGGHRVLPAIIDESEPSTTSAARDFRQEIRSFEIALIRYALGRTGGNKTAAARLLKMPLRTLVNKVAAHGLNEHDPAAPDAPPARDNAGQTFKDQVQSFERELLIEALREAEGKRAVAARILRLPLSTMLYKIKAYELG